jgi:SPP1 gp7 family putative phage head morphogenesis protein
MGLVPFSPAVSGPLPTSSQGYSQLAAVENDYMARLFGNEAQNLKTLGANYYRATRALVPLWKQAYARLQWAQQQGFDDTYLSGFIWSEQRMATIVAQLFERFTQLGTQTGQYLERELTEAAKLAQQSVIDYTNQQILEAGGYLKRGGVDVAFASAPHAELELLTARLGDGSPILESLAARFGAEGVGLAKEGLIAGLANGENPAQLARRMAKQMGAHAGKTAVLFRTEMMRVYRDTGLLTMRANSKLIKGWTWISALSDTTCPLCWAMHGTQHSLDDRMETHPACRCSQRPMLRPWGEINPLLAGATQPRPEVPGVTRFGQLTPASQRRILGPKLYQAYADKRIVLSNVVKRTYSPKWGGGRRAATASELLGGKQGPAPAPKPAPTPRPKPVPVAAPKPVASAAKGTPVSTALQTTALPKSGKTGELAGHIRETTKIIDGVHGDGQLTPIPVKLNQSSSALGQYVSRYGPRVPGTFDRTYLPSQINVSAKVGGAHTRLTFAHEVGHFLDQQHFGVKPGHTASTTYGSKGNPKLEAWRQAVDKSRAVAELKTLMFSPGATVPGTNLFGQVVQTPADTRYLRYALTDLELFARSYAQYIATKSRNPLMMAELEAERNPLRAYHQTQWAEDDFAPIQQAFDDLFRGEGWIE